MKKTAQNILFLISGVIFMCYAVIPLVHFYAIDQGISSIDHHRYFLEKTKFLELFTFIYIFFSINYLILGLNLFLNNKIEKIFSINRIIYIAIISVVLTRILMVKLFPPMFFFQ